MWSLPLVWAAVAAAYILLGALGLVLVLPGGYASPVFPAAGLALAVALHCGNRVLPAIWLGSAVLNLAAAVLSGQQSGVSLLIAAGVGTGATLQAWAGQYLIRRWAGRKWQQLDQERDIIRFLALGGGLACTVSASCALLVLSGTDALPAGGHLQVWWTWYAGDTLGVLTIAPLTLGLLQHRQPEWHARLRLMILPVGIMLLACILTVLLAGRWERSSLQKLLDDEGRLLGQILEQRFLAHHEALVSTARLFGVAPQLKLSEFDHLTHATLHDQPDLFALSFNPLISQDERASFERHMAQLYNTPSFHITERDAGRHLIRAAERAEYVPVSYISPLSGNRMAIGFDINSEPARRDAIRRARLSGNAAATAPIRLVQEQRERVGLLVLAPAFRHDTNSSEDHPSSHRLIGFAVAVVKVDQMVEIALGNQLPAGLVLELDDPAAPPEHQVLYRSHTQASTTAPAPRWQSTLMMADRPWLMRLLPTPEWLQQHHRKLAWIIGVTGLMFTTLLQILLLVASGRTALIQRKVEEQTRELRHTSASLAEREHFLHSLLDLIPGMVAYWDTRLHCVFANVMHQKWFARTPEEIRGLHVRELLGEELYQRYEQRLLAALRGERQTFEAALLRDDGTDSQLWVHYVPDIVNGQVRGFFVLASDITDLKQAQLQLEATNMALEQRTHEAEAASRAKSAFVANMSHEIRTPMNGVLGLLTLMQHGTLDAQQLDHVHKAESAARSLLAILDDILDLSRVESGKLELESLPFLLDELWQTMAALLSPALQDKPVTLRCDIDPGAPRALRGDALRLQQVLLNLLGNAVKFTEQGEIVVEVRQLHLTPQRVRLEFAVRDTGIGIPADRLHAVFESFTQAESSTSRHYGGTGLGLAISQRLVQLMGGTLQVDSSLHHGSCFHFVLEFALDAETRALERVAPASAAPHDLSPMAPNPLQGLRLLLVEDNPLNQEVALGLLRYAGAHVEIADNGFRALECMAGGHFDAVLMDIQMPDMDGYETTRRLRAAGCQLPIIAMTANALPSDREACLEAGMNDHIGKPIESKWLIATLLRHCGRLPASTAAPLQPSSPAASQALPATPAGFDLPAALHRVMDDRACYARLARKFIADQQSLVMRLRQAAAAGDQPLIMRELHTLKGLAALLGAMPLSVQARTAESSLQADGLAALATGLPALEQELAATFATLQTLATHFEVSTCPPASQGNVDPERLRTQLDALATLLAEHNIRALDLLPTLRQEAGNLLDAQLPQLEQAMLYLDVDTALALVQQMRASLND